MKSTTPLPPTHQAQPLLEKSVLHTSWSELVVQCNKQACRFCSQDDLHGGTHFSGE